MSDKEQYYRAGIISKEEFEAHHAPQPATVDGEVFRIKDMPQGKWSPIGGTEGGLWAYLFEEGGVQIAFQPPEDGKENTDVGAYIAKDEVPLLVGFLQEGAE